MGKRRHSDEFAYLRNEMTPCEEHLWYDFLKIMPFHMKRNYQIEDGLIAPFYSQAIGMVIETYNAADHTPEDIASEKQRDELYKEYDLMVLRFSDEEIMNDFERVCKDILAALNSGYTYSY